MNMKAKTTKTIIREIERKEEILKGDVEGQERKEIERVKEALREELSQRNGR